ncbi:MAG TPA: toll/interleukin-1 receptor domain-containing protein [Acetobacteraceae bacterium]|jgi:hypothetical protein|nr:toll/interleukin-1 receptor domain-containing protein [Acetobacteraceae bacterium]
MSFTLNGKPILPNEIGDTLMKAAVVSVANQMRERLSSIRHPDTGEFPTVVVIGDSLEILSCRVEGSPELLALIKARFSGEELEAMTLVEKTPEGPPRAFLSYAWDDRPLAQKIAEGLQSNGIETWWAEWEIQAGDSLVQKINEGLESCTHFIVLLTPNSISRPWVNQEMDAGLIRKIRAQSKFIALRYNLPATSLPQLLSGMLSPEVDAVASDLR